MDTNRNKGLYESLEKLSESDMLPMHMPGHKRRKDDEYLRALGARFDITEIHGFDDLHAPSGIIKSMEERAASLWGALYSRVLVGGSTCGILSAMYAAAKRGDKIIMSRCCHMSVYHAAELLEFETVYFSPPVDCKTGIYGSVEPDTVKKAIAENSDAVLVILTSPTYEGVISDIAEIADIAHSSNMLLLVDEAHGAHLGMNGFAEGAVHSGADMVVQSLHKTLSSLTQTAVLHICTDKVDPVRVSHAIDIFETSSPSYILMASADACIKALEERSQREWYDSVYAADKKLMQMKNLRLMSKENSSAVYDFDISKFTVLTDGRLSGVRLGEILREQYNIEVEMCAPSYIIAMSGMGDTRQTLERFADALLDIDSKDELFGKTFDSYAPPSVPMKAMSPSSALSSVTETVCGNDSVGRICAEYITAYPPGVPVLVPGELISDEALNYIKLLADLGCNIKSMYKEAPKKVSVVKMPECD